jgi:hypothetical protein
VVRPDTGEVGIDDVVVDPMSGTRMLRAFGLGLILPRSNMPATGLVIRRYVARATW